MKVVSDVGIENNVDVLGISKVITCLRISKPKLTRLEVAETLLDRKQIFMDNSDAFIVLPSGWIFR